jgi:uncharacterized protein with von Willebrand factor type A (vWA) domain
MVLFEDRKNNKDNNNVSIAKRYIYFPFSSVEAEQESRRRQQEQGEQNLSSDTLDKLLRIIGREVLREKLPSLQELEQILQDSIANSSTELPYIKKQAEESHQNNQRHEIRQQAYGQIIIQHLLQKRYLKDSQKWLSTKGFVNIGDKILNEVLRALKSGDFGLHSSTSTGPGSLIMDTTKKYELGDDIRLLNVPNSLVNAVQRAAKTGKQDKIPLDLDVEDLEEYETMRDVRVAVVYCIDLSSTMRYASMFGDMSRIEAAKRALWSLFLMNRKYFPSDSIYVVGFGALASRVKPYDIPYLKTFEPGSDFLHYTNYQSAFRLGSKILQKDGANNRRIVLITDGHPSACFIDTKNEQDRILSQRPYSHFYTADKQTLDYLKQDQDINLDVSSGELVYLCYRYRQVDQYIAEKTIQEARKCHRAGIEIDTIMISEEDSLLDYVNELERCVRGRSYYINPGAIDKMLFSDYLNNKKQIIRALS